MLIQNSNHTGIDHHWVIENPNYYINVDEDTYLKDKNSYFPAEFDRKTSYLAYGRDPYFPPWTDTVQLNYFNPATRRAMITRLKEIALHCDGVRCDMAMLVLNDIFQRDWGWANLNPVYPKPEREFWAEAIEQVPELVYIAEAYWDTEWTLQQLGFDFVYDKKLYDRIRTGSPKDVYLHLTADIGYQKKLLRFIENHDELRSAAVFGKNKAEMAAVLYSALPGMKLYFHGQMEGRMIKMPLQIRQTRFEAVDLEIQTFYHRLLTKVNEPVFHNGDWRLKQVMSDSDSTNDSLIAYLWKLGDELRLVTANLSRSSSRGKINFQEDIPESAEYLFKDAMTGQNFTASGKLMALPGLSFSLEGFQARIFDISKIN